MTGPLARMNTTIPAVSRKTATLCLHGRCPCILVSILQRPSLCWIKADPGGGRKESVFFPKVESPVVWKSNRIGLLIYMPRKGNDYLVRERVSVWQHKTFLGCETVSLSGTPQIEISVKNYLAEKVPERALKVSLFRFIIHFFTRWGSLIHRPIRRVYCMLRWLLVPVSAYSIVGLFHTSTGASSSSTSDRFITPTLRSRHQAD